MSRKFLEDGELPYCKGCGHSLVANNIDIALQKNNYSILDIIIVTDIGCHGIIDKSFKTHTIHGLHGRSVALASGISAGTSNPKKKVIVLVGDGGATIGMQHIIDAAHNNFNITVIVHNNMLYGMTGGQPSEFTPYGFKTTTTPEGTNRNGYDLCKLAAIAGASFVSRVIGNVDFSDVLSKAFAAKGFSLVEVMEICPSYGVKANPGMKLKNILDAAGLEVKTFVNKETRSFETNIRTNVKRLLNDNENIPVKYKSNIDKPVNILISGSAGEGVQSAAEIFAKAAVSSGLNVSKKGNYPVTVGVGFSSSDIIISPEEILFTGTKDPDIIIITSKEGLDYSSAIIKNSDKGIIFYDSSVSMPETKATLIKYDFRKRVPAKNVSLYALLYYVDYSKVFPLDAVIETLKNDKLSSKLELNKLLDFS
ncbi:MAG: thiamine pyrophosphate-dependent enzyme [Bacteroidota bacterium]